MKKYVTAWFVLDTPFNRENAKELRGMYFKIAPSYCEVRQALHVDPASVWENYAAFRGNVFNMGGIVMPETRLEIPETILK